MKHQILGAGLLLAMCAAPAAQAQISLVNPVSQEVKSAGKQLMSLPGKWTLKADAARLNAVKAQRPLDAVLRQESTVIVTLIEQVGHREVRELQT